MKRACLHIAGIAALLFAGCDRQDDLYGISSPSLQIGCDWVTPLDRHDMQDATAMFYKDGTVTKEYFSRPNTVTARVSAGRYDLLVFNGVMESEQATNLNGIYFRGTARPGTFEACAQEGVAARRLVRADGEYIAGNDMELFAFAHGDAWVEGGQEYYLKYRNGHNGIAVVPDHIESVIGLTPRAVSYRFRVKLTNLVNPTSARSASGALRGFAGSVFLIPGTGMPKAGFRATHHLNLTPSANGRVRTGSDGEQLGTAQSPLFVSFGPPLPESPNLLADSGRFTFELSFLLTDNSEFKLPGGPIDITAQVNEAIGRIYRHHSGEGDLSYNENLFTIEIADRITLPVIAPDKVVDVVPWDDEEIMVWIRP